MSKGLGAILSTGDSRSANSKQRRSCELQIVPGAVLGLPLDVTEQLRPQRQRLAI
jgi:hypothetical protein